jgi:mono/diheme cytochrome c family protein
MSARRGWLVGAGLVVAFAATGCGAARRSAPLMIAGPIPLDTRQQQGKVLFNHLCHQCHPGGDAATGPAINNKPIPRPIMKLQVRTGVLGTMPRFNHDDLTDDQLEMVMDYLMAMRKAR